MSGVAGFASNFGVVGAATNNEDLLAGFLLS